ncbi:flagellar basal body rod protein FlgB [Legionella bononiensis]|uniref:Flagellar basal body rod protein FlgB n=1 Tax=Legionella bononiensis TaxID=2793102 RepID=A0ABS1WBS3_9GAMM|nr:flagellar basal body rod protein FlgB [Legionella bononiensis]MBL7481101.1 flagellar basal body rod protein FlgB [Legionella bononiensis]MBL7526810.1 flagellar basal body rod protein FlgB [Legionella bononiensis]MBL7564217.1 flagellar basal body rod protein FlgB [Legionella bononiensis]
MPLNLDSYFGIHAKALIARDHRASQLANNLANVNTPNYKAMDMDFNEVLAASMAGNSQQLQVTSPNHINNNAEFSTQLKYRMSNHKSMDGNTVDKDIETAEFAKNALNYQASLSFLDSKIKSMIVALKGE